MIYTLDRARIGSIKRETVFTHENFKQYFATFYYFFSTSRVDPRGQDFFWKSTVGLGYPADNYRPVRVSFRFLTSFSGGSDGASQDKTDASIAGGREGERDGGERNAR